MTHLKECFKCKTVRPLAEFYTHSRMADGHLNKCKVCTKREASEYREKNIERVRQYDRDRAKIPERQKAAKEIVSAWRKIDKRRAKAHNAVSRAIKAGLLVRSSCVRCGSEKSFAHHEDYDKPLNVVWLCQPCHKQRHAEINKEGKKL